MNAGGFIPLLVLVEQCFSIFKNSLTRLSLDFPQLIVGSKNKGSRQARTWPFVSCILTLHFSLARLCTSSTHEHWRAKRWLAHYPSSQRQKPCSAGHVRMHCRPYLCSLRFPFSSTTSIVAICRSQHPC